MTAWRGVEEFLEVVRTGSFTAAAEGLGVSKSYVSKIIGELESRIGVQLMVRTTRRLALTAAGELFYARCAAMQDDLRRLERTMTQFQSGTMGRLRIALSDIFGSDFMSALLAEFSAAHPEITIEAIAYLKESEIAAQDFDVTIRYGDLEDSSQMARFFGYLSYCLCATPAYVAEHGWPSGPEDLGRHQCLSDLSGAFRFNGGIEVPVSGNWRSNSGVAMRWAARRGLGLAHLPISLVRTDLTDGRIVAMHDEWTFFDREVRAVFPAGIVPAATRAFVDFLTTRLSRLRIRPWMSGQLVPNVDTRAVLHATRPPDATASDPAAPDAAADGKREVP